MRALLLLALTALTLQAVPAAEAAPLGDGWTLPQLTVDDRTIKDVEGRTVLLRGANVNQLNDYAQNGTDLPTVAPLDRTDFARMATLGFDVVRLNVSWSALEPTRGAFDQAYVQRIRSAVQDAKDHGIYTVLDMHQDAWGPFVGTPAGQTCPPLLEPGIGWDGAPEWATLTGGWTTCNIGGLREASPAVARAFQAFYDDEQGIQGRLVATWARLAAEFADEPAVAGYDLLNEPNPGLRDPFTAADQIGRFYQRAIAAIRQAESGGFPHLIFFEPSAVWSAFGIDALPPRHYLADPLVVFSPHLYSQSITVSSEFPSLETGFRIAAAGADWYGAPLWTGEWGWFGEPDEQSSAVDRFVDATNEHRMGGAWWSWTQACGDPHAVRDGNTEKPQGNLNRIDCPSGRSLGMVDGFVTPLARAYPRATPGSLTDVTSEGFAGSGRGRVEAWYPGAEQPQLDTVNLADVDLARVDGGWRFTAHADGDYSVSSR
ncbi:cellulase family glycosylhydrolase [Rhodococcus sp. TAF43]|uniref:glycoside hydrolase family 5 protein n=1 Tax=unclassified Rhodococcus (in: high G+C Gram-positive bacteria) TaxID=192944 RepID=UPI000E0C0B4D|nr:MULTISPECIES: cellulase family glycosylhydrolase [unclassified Rhodococcus (in: high G+C Gram-positive bacteria)]QKT10397.1 cellulase family glycosylhydrolase [Rhodococcus sp. W8901]RDI35528.1 endoglycosylceramidase [Rhodococcus sp. AG1013]